MEEFIEAAVAVVRSFEQLDNLDTQAKAIARKADKQVDALLAVAPDDAEDIVAGLREACDRLMLDPDDDLRHAVEAGILKSKHDAQRENAVNN